MPMMIRFHRPRVRFRRTDPAGEELATAVELSLPMVELQSQTAMNYLAVHLPRTGVTEWLLGHHPVVLLHGYAESHETTSSWSLVGLYLYSLWRRAVSSTIRRKTWLLAIAGPKQVCRDRFRPFGNLSEQTRSLPHCAEASRLPYRARRTRVAS